MVTYPSDWKITSIDKLGKCYSGLSGKSADDFGTGSAYYITFLNVLKNIKVDMDALEKVSVSSGENQNAVKKGDLFFNTSSETPDEVGMCAVLLSDLNNVYLNSFCFGFRLYNTSVLSPLFASYFFNSIYGRRLMSLYAQGSTRYNLSKSSFIKMEIPVPSIKEQQAIAATLSYFDEHIDNLTELIEKKKAIRDGALNDLISGKARLDGFSGEWGTIPFNQYFTLLPTNTYSREQLSDSGEIGNIHYGDILINYGCVLSENDYIPKVIDVSKINARQYLKKNDVIIADTAEDDTVGKAVQVGDISIPLVSGLHTMACRPNYPTADGFLGYYINSNCYHDQILPYVTGIKVSSISKKSIGKTELYIPVDIKEQQAISEVLTAMDEEIESLKVEKEKMIQIKEGAMDDLLTGRVRLKI